MKYNYIYTLLLTIPLLLTSCLKDQEDIFDQSASERVNAAILEAREILVSAENGWRMDMFPSKTRDYGGYTLFFDFDEANVVACSELEDASYIEKSLWTVEALAGPVLSFDTYNTLIQYFSGPDKDEGNVDTGLGGDYDFMILEATKDRIKLKGTKTGNINYLTPIAAGENWTDLMTTYKAAAKEMQWEVLEYQVNGNTYVTNVLSRNFVITTMGADGAILQKVVPYIFTPTGIKFYEPLDLDGVKVSEMIYKVEGDVVTFEDINGSGAKFVVIKAPPLTTCLVSGSWYFTYSKIGSFGKQYWDIVRTNFLIPAGEELRHATLGAHGVNFGFQFQSGPYMGFLGYTPNIVSDNEIKLTFALSGDGNGVYYYNNLLFNYYISALGGSGVNGKTYTLTTDDTERPAFITMTDKANANNTYTLLKKRTLYPYYN